MRFIAAGVCIGCVAALSLCWAEDVQKHAETLIEHAKAVSDIRSEKAPAFRLKATFSFIGEHLETAEGTYTEVWVSSAQWYRETAVHDLHRIEIGGVGKRWLENSDDLPEPALRVTGLMQFAPRTAKLAFESVFEPKEDSDVECAVTKPGTRHEKYAFCVDKKSGVLLERVSPEIRPRNVTEYSCRYGQFQKFGNFWFPRHMVCNQDRHRDIEVRVVELSPETSTDPALFVASSKAIELPTCSVALVPPKAVSSPPPLPPSGSTEQSWVMLELLIDAKGKPERMKVLRSGGKRFDEAALSTVRGWRFKPASCNGEAIPSQIDVELDFQLFR